MRIRFVVFPLAIAARCENPGFAGQDQDKCTDDRKLDKPAGSPPVDAHTTLILFTAAGLSEKCARCPAAGKGQARDGRAASIVLFAGVDSICPTLYKSCKILRNTARLLSLKPLEANGVANKYVERGFQRYEGYEEFSKMIFLESNRDNGTIYPLLIRKF